MIETENWKKTTTTMRNIKKSKFLYSDEEKIKWGEIALMYTIAETTRFESTKLSTFAICDDNANEKKTSAGTTTAVGEKVPRSKLQGNVSLPMNPNDNDGVKISKSSARFNITI